MQLCKLFVSFLLVFTATNIPQTLTETSGLSSQHIQVTRTSSVPDESSPASQLALIGELNSGEDKLTNGGGEKINGDVFNSGSRNDKEDLKNQNGNESRNKRFVRSGIKEGDGPKVVVPRIDSELDAFFVTMAPEEEGQKTSSISLGLDYRIEDFDSLVRSEQQL